MARIEKYLCDIKGCENEATVINKTFQVVFFTDQTEGRSIKPYLSEEKLDLCNKCIEKIIKERKAICGSGCMGFNDYTI